MFRSKAIDAEVLPFYLTLLAKMPVMQAAAGDDIDKLASYIG